MSGLHEGEQTTRERADCADPHRHSLGQASQIGARRHVRESGEDVASLVVAAYPGFTIAAHVRRVRPAVADALVREPS